MTNAEYLNARELIGKRVRVTWRNGEWPNFILREVNQRRACVRLTGTADDAGNPHDGDTFWADWADIHSMVKA